VRVLDRALLVGRALLIVFASAVACSAQDKELRALADNLTSQIKSRGKGPVAITSFVNVNYCPAFSIFLVDRLSILIARGNADFDVVTRDRVEEVFKEINLALGKNYDASTFAKIGKQLGTRSLIRGSYTVLNAGATASPPRFLTWRPDGSLVETSRKSLIPAMSRQCLTRKAALRETWLGHRLLLRSRPELEVHVRLAWCLSRSRPREDWSLN